MSECCDAIIDHICHAPICVLEDEEQLLGGHGELVTTAFIRLWLSYMLGLYRPGYR